ncbi:MAG: MFS transporter [Deltaproteobacteria bacterium]|nr:MFS transporter [Deltaproteobacteria bacterium]
MSTTTRPSKESPLTAAQRWLLAAVGLSSLMVSSQTSALNAILPFVARSFGVDLPTIQWVVLAYLIVSSGLLLAFGRLGDMIGQRRLFLIGFAIFIGGSLLSSLAPDLTWLIATRIVQSVGGGMITSSSSPLITKTLPHSHRGRGLSAQIVMVYFGLSAGPGMGGILADTLGWRWVFLVNVPLGLLAAAVTLAAVPKDETTAAKQPFDWAGALTFMIALTSLFFLMGGGRGRQWFAGGDAVLFLVFVFAAGAFVALELRRLEPMLDLRLFKSRFFSAATASLHRLWHPGVHGSLLSRGRHRLRRHQRGRFDHGHAGGHDDIRSFQWLAVRQGGSAPSRIAWDGSARRWDFSGRPPGSGAVGERNRLAVGDCGHWAWAF